MEIFFDYSTKRKLAVLLGNIPNNVEEIYAAVAYSQHKLLIDECIKKKIKLEWWGLFNSGLSTDIDLIKQTISTSHIKFYPFAEYFHPKVIYLKNYGVYIGSANMTYSALYNNIEAGVFIYENELTQEIKNDLDAFFEYLRKRSIPITEDDLENLEKYSEAVFFDKNKIKELNLNLEDNFEELFSHLFLLKHGVTDYEKEKKDRLNEKRTAFLQEWRETQNYLQIIKRRIIDTGKQPEWVNNNAHPTIITDQLLHAYYYIHVLKGKDEKSVLVVNDYFQMNKRDPLNAVDEAIAWWGELDNAPLSEDKHINIWGVTNRELLTKIVNQDLSYEDFLTIFSQNHAALTHARQIRNKFFKLPNDYKTDAEGRSKIYVEWLYKQKSKKGINIQEILRYLIADNSVSLEDRIFNVIYDEKYKIEHFGKSIIGELVGWGRPDITHLRNNRVNKGLRCLGYDVKLFSD